MKFFLEENNLLPAKRFTLTEDDETDSGTNEQILQVAADIENAIGKTDSSLTVIQLLEIIAGLSKKKRTKRTYTKSTSTKKEDALRTLENNCVNIAVDAENDQQTLTEIKDTFKRIIDYCEKHKGTIWDLADTTKLSSQYNKIDLLLEDLENLKKTADDLRQKIEASEGSLSRATTAQITKMQTSLDARYDEVTAEVDKCLQTLNLEDLGQTASSRLADLVKELNEQLNKFTEVYHRAAEKFKEEAAKLGRNNPQVNKAEEDISNCRDTINEFTNALWVFDSWCQANATDPTKWLSLADETAEKFNSVSSAVAGMTDEINKLLRLLQDAEAMSDVAATAKGIKDWKSRFIAAAKKDLGLTRDASVNDTDLTKLFDQSKMTVNYEDSETAKVWAEYYKEEWGNNPTAIAVLNKIDVPLDKEIVAYGYTAETNPFIAFLKHCDFLEVFIDHPNNYSILHNAVTNNIVLKKDLLGTGELGKENIIFNKHLYTLTTSAMAEYLEIQSNVQKLYSLRSGSPFRTFDPKALADINDSNFLNTKYANIRDFVTDLFCKPGNVIVAMLDRQAGEVGAELNDYETVTKAMHVCFSKEDLGEVETNFARRATIGKKFSQDVWDDALKHLENFVKNNAARFQANLVYQRLIWTLGELLEVATADRSLFYTVFTDKKEAAALDSSFRNAPDTALEQNWLPYVRLTLGNYDYTDTFKTGGIKDLQNFTDRVAKQGKVGKYAKSSTK